MEVAASVHTSQNVDNVCLKQVLEIKHYTTWTRYLIVY